MATTVPRLELAAMPPVLRERLVDRVERLGYLGEFFRVAAHQPETLAAFIDFTEAGKAALSPEMTEVIALTCAASGGNAYERNQHEQLCVQLGFDRDWIESLSAPDSTGAALPSKQRLVRQFLLCALEDDTDPGPALEEVVKAIGPAAAVAVVLVAARYVAHSFVVDAFRLDPPVDSIFAGAAGSSAVCKQ